MVPLDSLEEDVPGDAGPDYFPVEPGVQASQANYFFLATESSKSVSHHPVAVFEQPEGNCYSIRGRAGAVLIRPDCHFPAEAGVARCH